MKHILTLLLLLAVLSGYAQETRRIQPLTDQEVAEFQKSAKNLKSSCGINKVILVPEMDVLSCDAGYDAETAFTIYVDPPSDNYEYSINNSGWYTKAQLESFGLTQGLYFVRVRNKNNPGCTVASEVIQIWLAYRLKIGKVDVNYHQITGTQVVLHAKSASRSIREPYTYTLESQSGELLTSNRSIFNNVPPGIYSLSISHPEPTTNGCIEPYMEKIIVLPEGVSVGSVSGSFDVSATGAATYTIPIAMPPGVGGMQPQVAISYNSQAGNGIAGWGCNLSGISAITRVPKSIYYDGKAQGLIYSNAFAHEDGFAWNGQRLVNNQHSNFYYPESDPYTKVSAVSNGSGLNSWEVLTKDGTKYTYGKASGQHTYAIGNITKIAAWYLERVENKSGNYVTYEYEYDDAQIYLKTITYGKNKNEEATSQASTISLIYEPRPDPMPFMLETVKGSTRRRLSEILTKTGDYLFRKYALMYGSDHFSRLVAVTETNGDGESFKPLELDWEFLPEVQYDPLVSAPELTIPSDDVMLSARDFDGDGIAELVQVGSYLYGSDAVRIKSVEIDNDDVLSLGFGRLVDYPQSQEYRDLEFILGMSFAPDLDGEGKPDFIVPRHIDMEINDKTIKGMRFEFPLRGPEHYYEIYGYKAGAEFPLLDFADLDNNGKDEVVLIEKDAVSGKYHGAILNLKLLPTSLEITPKPLTFTFASKPRYLFIADFNADGMKDLMVVCESGYSLHLNRNGTFLPTGKTGTNEGNNYMVRMGDFNGDGLPDLLTNATNDNNWYFLLNKGDGTFVNTLACTGIAHDQDLTKHDNNKFVCMVFDFDGDGKSDVVINKAMYLPKQNATQTWGVFKEAHSHWMRSTGTELEEVSSTISYNEDDALAQRFVVGDFDGDGKVELMNYGQNCYSIANDSDRERKWRLYKNPGMTANSGMLVSVTDGFENKTTVDYTPLTNTKVYTRDYKREHVSMINITPPISVVETVTTTSVETTNVNYTYGGAKAHVSGKGFLGFSSLKVANTAKGITSETGINQWDTTYFVPKETFNKTTVDKATATSVTRYAFFPVPGKDRTYRSHPTQKTDKDLDGFTTTTTYTFNNDNNLTGETTDYGDGMTQTTAYSNFSMAGGSMYQFPQNVDITRKHPDDDKPYTLTNTVTYNSWNANPASKTENGLHTQYSSYDRFGNPTVYKVSSHHNPLTYYNNYDSTGRFIVKQYTSPSSTVTTYQYDTWGNLLSETDETEQSNKLTTTYTYDGWGRQKSTTLPDGNQEKTDIYWIKSGGGQYYTHTYAPNTPWVKTYYDKAGREKLTESVGPKGMTVSATNLYNDIGQLSKTQHVQGGLTTWEKYEYDKRERIKKQESSSGQTTSYTYDKRQTTTTIDGKAYTKTFDAWGGIITAKEPDNEVKYTYKSIGQPWKITTGGITVEMDYDKYGNRTKLIDPNAGTTTYEHDASGSVVKQINQKGQMIQNGIDALGRITGTSMSGDGSLSYIYVPSGNGKLQLQRLTSSQHGVFEYTYDTYGRVLTEKRGMLVTTYAYDSYGNLETIMHPGDVTVKHAYDTYGYLAKVSVGTQTVWELGSATGLQTSVKMGAMTATTQYSDKGLLTGLKTVNNAAITIRDFGYEFNNTTGNLTFRTGMYPEKEVFGYDDINRLTTITKDEVLAMGIEYEANGNIHKKQGLGTYGYAPDRPYAVETIENTARLIPTGDRTAKYTSFQKINYIHEVLDLGNQQLQIQYGPDLQRWSSNYMDAQGNTTYMTYAGDYEKISGPQGTKEFYYIAGGDGLAAVYVKQTGQPDKLLYVHTDHLGSIVALTDENGADAFRATYDAWGKQTVSLNTIGFRRGYTGHEHLPEFGLINMNGRMYDPVIARFLSPDPFVQDPDFSQSFNRYSYCWNNPLVYTDPSGEWIAGALFIVAMTYISGTQSNFMYAAQNGGNPFNPGDWNWNSPWTYVSMAASAYSAYAQAFSSATTIASSNSRWLSYEAPERYSLLASMGEPGYAFPRSNFLNGVVITPSGSVSSGFQNIATYTQAGRSIISGAAAAKGMSNHQRTMSNPIVQNIHRAQSGFWGGAGDFFNHLNGTGTSSNGFMNRQVIGGTAPIPGRAAIKGGYNITSTAVRSATAGRIGKRGFSEVGYQFQKHFGRGGDWGLAIPQGAKLNPATLNQAGYETFKHIWKAPGSFKKVGGFIEKRLPDGRGIRLQENWQFKGFLD